MLYVAFFPAIFNVLLLLFIIKFLLVLINQYSSKEGRMSVKKFDYCHQTLVDDVMTFSLKPLNL